MDFWLDYLYAGATVASLAPTDTTVALCCTLLRLADMWMYAHLKSAVEAWFAHNDIVDLYNCVPLMTRSCPARSGWLWISCRPASVIKALTAEAWVQPISTNTARVARLAASGISFR